MADQLLDQLTEITSPDATDLVYVEHDPTGAQSPRKCQAGNLGATGTLEFWIGHPDAPYLPQSSVAIVGSRQRVTFGVGPYVLAAGDSITFFPHILRGTTNKTLSMGTGQSELYVSNADCTQRLAVENDNVSDLLAVLDTPIPISAIDVQTGTDLSIANGNSIKSTAGGVFWAVAVITVDFT